MIKHIALGAWHFQYSNEMFGRGIGGGTEEGNCLSYGRSITPYDLGWIGEKIRCGFDSPITARSGDCSSTGRGAG